MSNSSLICFESCSILTNATYVDGILSLDTEIAGREFPKPDYIFVNNYDFSGECTKLLARKKGTVFSILGEVPLDSTRGMEGDNYYTSQQE